MRRYLVLFATCIFFFSIIISCGLFEKENTTEPGEPGTIDEPSSENPVQGDIIVKIDPMVSLHEVDELVSGIRIKTFAYFNNCRYLLYDLSDDQNIEDTLVTLMASGKVIHAEKNEEYSLCFKPDDTYYDHYQYSPRITHCEDAWDITQGDNSIIVAILDTGINGNHEDLTNRVIAGRDIVAGEDIPASINSDSQGHGTYVAGITGAIGNNGKGIAGVTWNVQLMPVKVFSETIYTTSAHIAEGLIWAIDHEADIVNMSLGGGLFSVAVNDAVNYAHQKNVVLVAAMGNDYKAKIKYPAALPGIIAVGSSNGRDEVSNFSTSGYHISVVAPGESIYSLKHSSNTEYMFGSGTSAATPFVAGIAALLLSVNPDLNPEQVRSIIEDGADPLGADDFDPEYGHGRVNVYNTLTIPERNNYGSITVQVTNKGEPIGGIKVLILDNTDSRIIQAGITSHGGTSGGVNGQIVFNFIRLGDYKVRVQVGSPQVYDVSLTAAGENQTVLFAFDTSLVLIVNAIKIVDMSLLTDEFLYMRKLSAMGEYYSTWKTAYHGPPTSTFVNAYDKVIWFTGRTRDDPNKKIEVLNEQEREVIQNYLDNGGRLYLCGNNIAQSLSEKDPVFLNDYLHAQYVTSPLSHEQLNGKGLLDNMLLTIYMEDNDQIDPIPDAVGILDASDEWDENHWAGLSWDTGYRLVYTTIDANQISYCYPNTFLEDIMHWLDN